MGRWKYRKPEPSTVRGFCVKCGNNPQKRLGKLKFRPLCSQCDKREYSLESSKKSKRKYLKKKRRPYREHVGTHCTTCGFKPQHICQLDVDHIDGNHENNSIENLQTLCANCHRLKTHLTRPSSV